MPKHDASFTVYGWSDPPKTIVWCAPGFRAQVSGLFKGCSAAEQKDFANINELVKRFGAGEQLANMSFPQEPPGYAFKAGRIRFYGVFSKKHGGCFVLSHAIVKRHGKLRPEDQEKMKECLKAFDALEMLPEVNK